MADDERLLELLEQALAPERSLDSDTGPVEPAPERVAAVRLLVELDAPSPRSSKTQRPQPRPPDRVHRAAWLAAGVSVAAAAVVIAMLVLPTVFGGRQRHGTTSANGPAPATAVVLLRAALMSGNPVTVARADSNLLREERTIAAPERDDAVAAHVEAIQFLRDHPSADAAAALSPPSTLAPAREPRPTSTAIAPLGYPDRGATAPEPVPTTVAPPPTVVDGLPEVAIQAVVVRLDGTFDVEFSASGFTPDAGGGPGTHAVRFSFDEGQSPTIWAGSSPWSFSLVEGVTYHRVCAHVADAAGVEDLSTGGCRDIV